MTTNLFLHCRLPDFCSINCRHIASGSGGVEVWTWKTSLWSWFTWPTISIGCTSKQRAGGIASMVQCQTLLPLMCLESSCSLVRCLTWYCLCSKHLQYKIEEIGDFMLDSASLPLLECTEMVNNIHHLCPRCFMLCREASTWWAHNQGGSLGDA